MARLVKLHPAGRRWPNSVRAALCMGVPVTVGWATGDISAGLVATIGAFTSLYGSDRPYRNRSIFLAGVALSFAIAVSLGIWAQQISAAAVAVIVLIAVISTYGARASTQY